MRLLGASLPQGKFPEVTIVKGRGSKASPFVFCPWGSPNTSHSDKSQVEVDSGQKTLGGVATHAPEAYHHRASRLDSRQRHEILRQQLTLPETTEAGQNYHLWTGSSGPFSGDHQWLESRCPHEAGGYLYFSLRRIALDALQHIIDR